MPEDRVRKQQKHNIGAERLNEHDSNKGKVTKQKDRLEDYFPQVKNVQAGDEQNSEVEKD